MKNKTLNLNVSRHRGKVLLNTGCPRCITSWLSVLRKLFCHHIVENKVCVRCGKTGFGMPLYTNPPPPPSKLSIKIKPLMMLKIFFNTKDVEGDMCFLVNDDLSVIGNCPNVKVVIYTKGIDNGWETLSPEDGVYNLISNK